MVTDFSGSLGMKGDVQNDKVTECIKAVARKLVQTDLDLVVGGGISIASLPELNRIAQYRLTRFETRKVVFDGARLPDENLADSLLDAVHFEILWLINKSDYYGALHHEDKTRIAQLEERWTVLQREIIL